MQFDAPPGQPPSPPSAPEVRFTTGAPLGGVQPVATPEAPPSDRRELLLTATLLACSLVAGAASLLSWRDFGERFGAPLVETGWERADGSLGRGWVAVVLAVLVALSGVLIAAERQRAGRTLAVVSALGIVVLAVAEWGFGAGSVRTGPGTGLWVLLVVGVVVVVAVGALAPAPDDGGGDVRS